MDVSLQFSTPTGNIEVNVDPYELAGSTFESVATTMRRMEVSNPFVEGTYVVNALRENQQVPVSIYVRGATHDAMTTALAELTAVFSQSTFEARAEVEGVVEYWQCFASNFTVSTQREFLHATMARVDVQLDRNPGTPGWANQYSVLGG